MERKAKVTTILCMLLLSMLPFNVHAEDSGGVQAGTAQVSLLPTNPAMGQSVDISVALFNSQSSTAFNVDV
ncbi:MAG: hypothetical protein ACPG79_08160, partial [Poseidonia sp.]